MYLLLPISQDTMKALTRDLFGVSRSQSAAIWSAVQARHHKSSLEPPLGKPREFTASKRALAHIMGRPLVLKHPQNDSIRKVFGKAASLG